MNNKKKIILSSVMSIALCLSLIAGSTFALFTDETEFNIAVTSGDVEILAMAGISAVYSAEGTNGDAEDVYLVDENNYDYVHKEQALVKDADGKVISGVFFNGGVATINGANLKIERLTPGDRVDVDINVENKSNVAMAYRYKITANDTDDLAKGMVVTIDGVPYEGFASWTSEWFFATAPDGVAEAIPVKKISVELPVYAGNEYQSEKTDQEDGRRAGEKSVEYTIIVEAVQRNANIAVDAPAIVELFDSKTVSNADSLVEALENGENVLLTSDVKIDPASMSNAYGTTGINVTNGQTIDGGGHTLDIKGAGGTWDSGINTTGGIIRNITVTGSFRGIFINHNSTYSEKVILKNVIIDGTTYTISCDQGMKQGVEAIDSTFNGWTSFAATLGNAQFIDCSFGEGNGYAYCRPYAPTEFVGCDFEAGFEIDPRAAVTFENCTIGGVALTAENLATLVTSNIQNASVK